MKLIKSILLGAVLLTSISAWAVDVGLIEKQLTTTGVQGWIHGAIHQRGMYAFTYRNPDNFFDYLIMSLVTDDPAIQAQLAKMGRHDLVLVKGHFLDNPSPQKHIRVASITLVKKYDSKYPSDPYQYEAKLPDDLLHINQALFLVHAVAGDGHILVVEFKDAVVPVFVQNAALTKGLFRGDVVEMKFKIQKWPDSPTHINIDETAPTPLRVVDSVKALHGKPADVEGALVFFPKSPEIKFNVFAVQQELPGNLKRQFTLVNFDDPAAFAKIRAALQKAWDKYPGQYYNGRNKLISKRIAVHAVGTFNEVDPSQANPQILLKSVDSIKIIER